MFTKSAKNVFSIVLVCAVYLVDFAHCQYDCTSCATIQSLFEQGRTLYSNLDAYNKYLAADGYVMEPDDVGYVFINDGPTPSNLQAVYDGANAALFGIANIYDKCFTNSDAVMTNNQFQTFFSNATQCISVTERANFNTTLVCDPNAKYRTYDGTCNNLTYPQTGAAEGVYSRKVPAHYENFVQDIRLSEADHGELPSPRVIVDDIFTQPLPTTITGDLIPNVLWFFFGQFITHDISFQKNIPSKQPASAPIRCCASTYWTKLPPELTNSHACAAISVPSDDANYAPQSIGCLNFVRSERSYAADGRLEPANQMNQVTGYLDLSSVYGSSEARCDKIRTFNYGRLKINDKQILPLLSVPDGNSVYLTADERANQTPQLAVITALWVKFHNFVAYRLSTLNPSWNDETVFQETKRLLTAIFQHIIYMEYVPVILQKYLVPATGYTTYNPNVKGTAHNEFSTGAFRTFHTQSPSSFQRMTTVSGTTTLKSFPGLYYTLTLMCDGGYTPFFSYNHVFEDGAVLSSMTLSESLGNTAVLEEEFAYIRTLNGMLYQPIKMDGVSTEIINKMFGDSDLVSTDIMRGRDHGLQTYADFRQYYNMSTIYSWSDLTPIMASNYISLLQGVYKTPGDIDLIVGLLLENKGNNVAGPTTKSIIEDQFIALRDGDRYFYTHSDSPGAFTSAQLSFIRSFSLARIICSVTGRTDIQPQAFYGVSTSNARVNCSIFPTPDFSAWKV